MIELSGGPFHRKIQLGAALLLEVEIRTVRTSRDYPEEVRYRCYLGNPNTREVIVLYDIHPGKPHHRHVRGREEPYPYYHAGAVVGRFRNGCGSRSARRAMKVKRIKIGIKSWEENKKELRGIFRQTGHGGEIPTENALYFTDLETFRKCLTPKRLELLWIVADKHPQSVRELAALLKREPKNVSEDLGYLCQVGLVEFRPSAAHGNARAPVVPYDRVDLSLDLRRRAA